MKEVIGSYHMFLPRTWLKWCIYILYPVFVVGSLHVLYHYMQYFPMVCVCLGSGMIVAAEMMLDTYVFLGIGARDTNRLEYLKTSAKGMSLLKKALIMDGARRFFSTLLILLGVYFVMHLDGGIKDAFPLIKYVLCAEIVFALMELGFIVTRRSTNVWINLIVTYILVGIADVISITVVQCEVQAWMLVTALAAGSGLAVVGRRQIGKRAEESYYDERTESVIENDEIWE
ncbi:MAG: hypothetical protein K2J90_14860 [Lachnospiraceae bacterium]|nr:hypothetical protein [Lachnospiraceae bacterium]